MRTFPADPLAALARLIGQNDPFISIGRYPSVRQIPYKYHTDEYGPVLAYAVSDDGTFAHCVSADDKVVGCTHEQLLPFRVDVSGADAIELLDSELSEMMSPHMDGRSYKYQPPFRSTIGRFLFEMRVWQGALHDAAKVD
jgi:hypothetical protein